jgi:hypothetical protein
MTASSAINNLRRSQLMFLQEAVGDLWVLEHAHMRDVPIAQFSSASVVNDLAIQRFQNSSESAV